MADLLAPTQSERPPMGDIPTRGDRRALLDDLRARIRAITEPGASIRTSLQAVDTLELPFLTTETPKGPLHVRMKRLSAAHRIGRASVASAIEASAEWLALLALDPKLHECDLERGLFLDIETTRCKGVVTPVVFLVGLGWWDGRTLILEQTLIRSLREEASMLEHVCRRLEAASVVVTFNGKAFDLPLLRSRFAALGMPLALEPPHLDLLHVARRIHPRRFAHGRRLVNLENDFLGFERIDEVPSGRVSLSYRTFLQTGDVRALLGVIEHNAWDVAALAALIGIYGEPYHAFLSPEDLAGVAHALRRAGALSEAFGAAQAAVERATNAETLRARATVAKALGDRVRAFEDFEALASMVDDPGVHLELAKLHEHWLKAPRSALMWAERGTGESIDMTQRRIDRLKRKIQTHRHHDA
jgi:uncharacterized protein YprB with RNaseH-like and TPR domain